MLFEADHSDATEFQVYDKNSSHSNEFLDITNGDDVVEFVDEIPWDGLVDFLLKNSSKDEKRQKEFINGGYTSSVCTSRSGSHYGVALPVLKPDTKNKDCQLALRVLSDYVRHRNRSFKWLGEGETAFGFDDPSDPMKEWATNVGGEGNIFTAFHLGLSDAESPLEIHCDAGQPSKFDPLERKHACIASLSKGVRVDGKLRRLVFLGFGRKSLFDAEKRIGRVAPMVDFVCSEFEKFGAGRTDLSHEELRKGEPVPSVPGLHCLKNPCNLDAFGFVVSTLSYLMKLEKKFQLTQAERVAILWAQGQFPNTSYHFCAAAHTLLQTRRLDPIHRRGFNFGYLLLRLMVRIDEKIREQGLCLPPRRYCQYKPVPLVKYADFNGSCQRLLLSSLSCPPDEDVTKSPTSRKDAFNTFVKSLDNELKNVSDLGCHHLAGAHGSFGTVPKYCASEVILSKSKPIQWLRDKFALPEEVVQTVDIFNNVKAALHTRFSSTLR